MTRNSINSNITITQQEENKYSSKLLLSIKRKENQSTILFSSIVLILSNINIAHYFLIYMISINGIGMIILILLVFLIIAYHFQSNLISYLLIYRNTEERTKYSDVVSFYLNNIYSSILEIILILWIIIYISIAELTLLQYMNYIFDSNNKYIYPIFFTVSLLFFLCLLYKFDEEKKILKLRYIVYISLLIQILNSILVMTNGVYKIINLNDNQNENDKSISFFSYNESIYSTISILSSSVNTIIYIFKQSDQIESTSKKESKKMIGFCNIFVFIYFLLQCFNSFISIKKGFFISKFSLFISIDNMKSNEYFYSNHLFLLYSCHVWFVINILNQFLLCLYHFNTIITYSIRDFLYNKLYLERDLYRRMSISLIFLSTLLISIVYFIYSFDIFFLVLLCFGGLGVFINFLFPLLVYMKISNDRLFSISIIIKCSIVFILLVFTFSGVVLET